MSCDPERSSISPLCGVTSQVMVTGDNDSGWGCDHNILMRVSKTVTSL